MTQEHDTSAYYARRAGEYEQIYRRPERQADLATLRSMLVRELADHDVLEVACGTGYWTEPIAAAARSILATDVGDEVLDLARAKHFPKANVRFARADAFTLTGVSGEFTAAFAGFWWSHIARSALPVFLSALHTKLRPGALVVLADNTCVVGSSTPVSRTDDEGNTYQLRTLADRTTHEVMKNFPSEADLRAAVAPFARDLRYTCLRYYWCLTYCGRVADGG